MIVTVAIVAGALLAGYLGHKLITRYLKSIATAATKEAETLKASAEAEALKVEAKL